MVSSILWFSQNGIIFGIAGKVILHLQEISHLEKRLNKIGPSTDPCGIPQRISFQENMNFLF